MNAYDVLYSLVLVQGIASNENCREVRLPTLSLLETSHLVVHILEELGNVRLIADWGGQHGVFIWCEARRTQKLQPDRSCFRLLRRPLWPRTWTWSRHQVRSTSEPCTPDAALR